MVIPAQQAVQHLNVEKRPNTWTQKRPNTWTEKAASK